MEGKENKVVPLVWSTALPDSPPRFLPIRSDSSFLPLDQGFGEALSPKGIEEVLVLDLANGGSVKR